MLRHRHRPTPDALNGWLRKTDCLERLARYADAAAAAEKALSLETGDRVLRERAARLHLRAGNTTDALTYLIQVLKFSPDNAELLTLIGDAQERAGMRKEAADTYARVLELNEDSVAVAMRFAALCESLGRFGEAAEAYRRVAMAMPENPAPDTTGPPPSSGKGTIVNVRSRSISW